MSDNKEKPTEKKIVRPRTELRWPPFHSNLLSEDFLSKVKSVFDEMLERLYYGAEKRKGWAAKEPWQELTEDECRSCVRNALVKGNLIDAMNYVMFTHLNGFSLTTLRQQTVNEPVSVDSQMRDQLAKTLGVTGCNWDEMLDHVVKMRKDTVEQTEAFAQIAAALQMGPETPPKHLANIIESQKSRITNAVQKISVSGTGFDAATIKAMEHANKNHIREIGRASVRFGAPRWTKLAAEKAVKLSMQLATSVGPETLFVFSSEKDRDDYLPLLRTFLGALEQAAYGKGRVRHANDLPFIEQPILTMAQMLNSDAGLAQQVIKKTIEARTLPTKAARISELHGTLVYAAAMILFEEMHGRQDDPDELDGDL